MIATEPISAPVEVVTPIKPSEAIRLGCLTTAPGSGNYVSRIEGRVTACAYGAMAVGYGFDPDAGDLRHLDDFLIRGEPSIAQHLNDPCPEPDCKSIRYDPLIHLNDDRRWSRERIADWLEGLGL